MATRTKHSRHKSIRTDRIVHLDFCFIRFCSILFTINRLAQNIPWLQELSIPDIYRFVLTDLFTLMPGPRVVLESFQQSIPFGTRLVCAQVVATFFPSTLLAGWLASFAVSFFPWLVGWLVGRTIGAAHLLRPVDVLLTDWTFTSHRLSRWTMTNIFKVTRF